MSAAGKPDRVVIPRRLVRFMVISYITCMVLVLAMWSAVLWHQVSIGRLSWAGFGERVVLVAMVVAGGSAVGLAFSWLLRKLFFPDTKLVRERK